MGDTRFVQTATPGGTLFIEVEDYAGFVDINPASKGDKDAASFERATQMLKTNTEHVIDSLESLGLEEIEVSCGLKMGFEGGNSFWGLAKVSSEANVTIKVKWKSS